MGLSFVLGARYAGAEDIEFDVIGDRIGGMRTLWDFAYRMDYDDPAT
jgi:hypothetical protein